MVGSLISVGIECASSESSASFSVTVVVLVICPHTLPLLKTEVDVSGRHRLPDSGYDAIY